jgi:hypothetical protein
MGAGNTNTWGRIALEQDGDEVNSSNPLVVAVVGAGGSSVDRVFVTTQWTAKAIATGMAAGDLIVQADEYDVTTNPATFLSTTWRNVTQNTNLASAPVGSNLSLVAGSSSVSILNFPTTQAVSTGRAIAVAGKTVVTIAGTPVNLGSQVCGDGITVIANPANTGKVYVFPAAGSKTDVVPLVAGDSNFFPVANISALKVDADTSGDSVYWQGAV